MGLGVIKAEVHCHGVPYVEVAIGLGRETSDHLMWCGVVCVWVVW